MCNFDEIEKEVVKLYKDAKTLLELRKHEDGEEKLQEHLQEIESETIKLKTLTSKHKELKLQKLEDGEKKLQEHLREIQFVIKKLETLISEQEELKSLIAIQRTNISIQENKIYTNIPNYVPNVMTFITLLKKCILLNDTIEKNNEKLLKERQLLAIIPIYKKVPISKENLYDLNQFLQKNRNEYYCIRKDNIVIEELGTIDMITPKTEMYRLTRPGTSWTMRQRTAFINVTFKLNQTKKTIIFAIRDRTYFKKNYNLYYKVYSAL